MANEIVKLVAQKTNLPEPMARIAVSTVINFLKDKLPPAIGGTLDNFVNSDNSGGNDDDLDLGDITGALGGLFGKK